MAKDTNMILLAIAAVVVVLIATGTIKLGGSGAAAPAVTTSGSPGSTNANPATCPYAPAYTYGGVDFFTGASQTVTPNIKLNGDFPVTSLDHPTPGSQLNVWYNATDIICEQYTGTAKCGNWQVQSKCYQNSSATLSIYDNKARATLTAGGGATNVTIAANDNADLEFDYTGIGKKSGFPLGGCIVVEVPTTITSVTLGGAGTSVGCPYPITYSASAGNTYKLFTLPSAFDVEANPTMKKMGIQLGSSSTNPSGFANVTMYAANYYTGNDGQIYLGIEKDKNGDTTKTSSSTKTTSFRID